MLWKAYSFLITAVETAALFAFTNSILDKKTERGYVPLLLCCLAASLFAVRINEHLFPAFGGMIICLLVDIPILKMAHKGTALQILHLVMLFYIVNLLVEILTITSIAYAGQYGLEHPWTGDHWQVAAGLSAKFIMTAAILAARKYLARFKEAYQAIEKKDLCIQLASCFSIGTLIVLIIPLNGAWSREETLLSIQMAAVGLLAFLTGILCFTFRGQLLKSYREKERQADEYLRKLDQYNCLVKENEKDLARREHDLRHHISYAKAIVKMGQSKQAAEEYLDNIIDQYDKNRLNKTGNLKIDTIIYSKYDEMRKKGIDFKLVGQPLPEKMAITTLDLSAFLANLLENAIEACEVSKVPEKEKEIVFKYKYEGSCLFLEITNPAQMKSRNTVTFKSQKGKGHGYGLESINAIVRKYQGHKKILVQDGRVCIKIYLQV